MRYNIMFHAGPREKGRGGGGGLLLHPTVVKVSPVWFADAAVTRYQPLKPDLLICYPSTTPSLPTVLALQVLQKADHSNQQTRLLVRLCLYSSVYIFFVQCALAEMAEVENP
jgi:hypothetical protein